LFTGFLRFSLFRADISSSQNGQQLFEFHGSLPVSETCEQPVDKLEQHPELPLY